MRKDPAGLAASVAGASLGSAAASSLLGYLGATSGTDGLESVGAMVYGIYIGAFTGAVLGCWAALRIGRRDAAGATAFVLALALVVFLPLGTWVASVGPFESYAAAGVLLFAIAIAAFVSRVLGRRLAYEKGGDPGWRSLSSIDRSDRPDPAPWEDEPFGPTR